MSTIARVQRPTILWITKTIVQTGISDIRIQFQFFLKRHESLFVALVTLGQQMHTNMDRRSDDLQIKEKSFLKCLIKKHVKIKMW